MFVCQSGVTSFLVKLDCVNAVAGCRATAGEDAAVGVTSPTLDHFEQIPGLYCFSPIVMLQQTEGHNPDVAAVKLLLLQEH